MTSYLFRQIISGDDDLPMKDDIGERRRKHELRVLAGAGIKSDDDVEDEPKSLDADGAFDMEEDNETESDFEFYREVEKQHEAKLAAKAKMYSRSVNMVETRFQHAQLLSDYLGSNQL